MRRAPLLQVPRVLQTAAAPLTALNHIVDLVSDFLDVSTGFSIPTAASSKSTLLMERVVMRVTSNQSLSPALLSHWFGQALEEAITNNDLSMVQKIHTLHPESLDVYSLRLAMEFGSLEMVQWVVEHRHDRLCCSPGVKNLCERCVSHAVDALGKQDAVRVVEWLAAEGAVKLPMDLHITLRGALLRSVELVRRCYDRGLIPQDVGDMLLDYVLLRGNTEALIIAHYLATRGFTITNEQLRDHLVSVACDPKRISMAEFLVSSPLCDPIRHCFTYAATHPNGAKVLQWTREFMDDPVNAGLEERIAYRARQHFHVDTMKWLYDERDLLPSENIMVIPSRQELLQFFEWRLEDRLPVGTANDTLIAARSGYLDVLQWLRAHTVAEFTTNVMDLAAGRGHLVIVEWLHDHSPVGCTTDAMDYAAAQGHLAVVQWLHHNRTEGCTSRALELAAGNGHVETVQWLCENRSEHDVTAALVRAAMNEELAVLQWLCENREDACTPCAIKTLIERCGWHGVPLTALRWLRAHSSKVACTSRCGDPQFGFYWLGTDAAKWGELELLEFIMEHYPDSEPPGELLKFTDPSNDFGKYAHPGIVAWIRARQRGPGGQPDAGGVLQRVSRRCSVM